MVMISNNRVYLHSLIGPIVKTFGVRDSKYSKDVVFDFQLLQYALVSDILTILIWFGLECKQTETNSSRERPFALNIYEVSLTGIF